VRSLSPEEAQLWARVTATIAPLSRDKTPPRATEIVHETPPAEPARTFKPTRPVAPVAPPRSSPGATLDGTWDRRLRSGSVEPDRVLDLHGMNLDQAWRAIDEALERAIGRGERVLLLVTGHHRPGEPPVQRGRIRAAVHDWLAHSRHSGRIAAVRGAHRRHGGGGSLYIILRRIPERR
jgi:DNA-nicking Smr family endonuclease